MNIKTNLFKNASLSGLKLSTLLLVSAFSISVAPPSLYAAAAKISVSADSAEDENFDKKFREGRDLIDKQEWKKAGEKFSEVIDQYPTNKSTDAALYWLAFCYKKQREFEKMGAAVDRLLKNHPTSSWTSDAQVLLIEVAAPVNGLTATIAGDKSGSVYSVFAPAQITGRALTSTTTLNRAPNLPGAVGSPANTINFYTFNDVFGANSKITLDREDEIRLAAFRSLLSANRQKALDATGQILRNDSKSSEVLKIEVLRVLRRPQVFSGYSISTGGEFSAMGLASPVKPATSEKSSNAPLREIMIKAFQENSSSKIRGEIVYTLASLKDETSIAKVGEIYDSESDVEVKKAVINSLGSSNFAFGNFSASNISRTATPSDLAALSELSSTESATRAISTNKLLEIVRTEKTPELRRLALSSVQRFGGWNKNGQMSDILSQIYDSETDEAFKKSIIQSFAKINEPQTTRKLIEIAKTEKSDALKLEAIRALGQSKDPEALKYLEEIIK